MNTRSFSISGVWGAAALLAALFLWSGPAAAATTAGEMLMTEGEVLAVSDGQTRPLKVASPVFQADVIRTGANAKARFRLGDGSMVSMGQDSEIAIAEYVYQPEKPGVGNLLLKVASGIFRFVSGALASKDKTTFQVAAPLMTMGVRGTDFGLEATGDGNLTAVFSGGPVLAFDPEFNKTVKVDKEEYVSKKTGAALDAPKPLTAEIRERIERGTGTALDAGQNGKRGVGLGASTTWVDILLYAAILAVFIYFVFFH